MGKAGEWVALVLWLVGLVGLVLWPVIGLASLAVTVPAWSVLNIAAWLVGDEGEFVDERVERWLRENS